MNNEYRMYHKKSDRTWPLCDPVGKGGTMPSGKYPHIKSQADAFKSNTDPSGHLRGPQAQNHAGPSKNQRN